MEAFRYMVALVSLFDMSGAILHQNATATSFYEDRLKGPEKHTALRLILGHDMLNDKIRNMVNGNGVANVITMRKEKDRKTVTRRNVNATYGLDPITGKRMIVLDETYTVEDFCYEGEDSFQISNALQLSKCPLEVSRRAKVIPSPHMDSFPTEVLTATEDISEDGTSSPSQSLPASDLTSNYSSAATMTSSTDGISNYPEDELDYYKRKCAQLIKRCEHLALIGIEISEVSAVCTGQK